MPLYEFGCPSCGVVTTELYRMGESGEGLACGQCGRIGLIKHISGFASLGVPGGFVGGQCSQGCHGNCSGCH